MLEVRGEAAPDDRSEETGQPCQTMRQRNTTSWTMKMAQSNNPKKPDACPKCGSKKLASILYGLPMLDEKPVRQLDAGEIVWGGCTIIPNKQPIWQCVECHHRFGHPSDELAGYRLAEELDRLFGEQ